MLSNFEPYSRWVPLKNGDPPSNRNFTEITRWEPLSLNGKGLRAVSEQRTRNDRKSRSSVFLCFETKRKRLLRKLGAHERKRISQGCKPREMSTFMWHLNWTMVRNWNPYHPCKRCDLYLVLCPQFIFDLCTPP